MAIVIWPDFQQLYSWSPFHQHLTNITSKIAKKIPFHNDHHGSDAPHYHYHRCTSSHTGTSASSPMAAGIIALVLEVIREKSTLAFLGQILVLGIFSSNFYQFYVLLVGKSVAELARCAAYCSEVTKNVEQYLYFSEDLLYHSFKTQTDIQLAREDEQLLCWTMIG